MHLNKHELRIGSINVNCIPVRADDNKNEELLTAIAKAELDITLMQEIGVNWSRISRPNQWNHRVREYMDPSHTKSVLNHNRHDITNCRWQYGGTGIITHGKLAHFSMGAGSDKAQLGRWTWARYQGKGGVVLRCVSIYQPCANQRGARSVWSQHKQYLQENNDDRVPRTAFRDDLEVELAEWLETGDQIVIAGDVNESVFHESIAGIFERHNLRNVVFEGRDPTTAPKTYYNTAEGRVIDGMWATPGITAIRSGYLAPGDFPGNHSLVWLDVSYQSALGHNPAMPQTPQARRLKTGDKKVTKRYLDHYEAGVKRHRLEQRQQKLKANTTKGTPLTPLQKQEANAIDYIKTKCMLQANKKCRKIKAGCVKFSAATDGPLKEIQFWNLAIRRRRGHDIGPTKWRRAKAEAKISIATKNLEIPDMIDLLRLAKAKYRTAKRNCKDERVQFLNKLPKKQREAILRREQQRDLARAAKRVTGKSASKSVTKIVIDGQECSNRQEMEARLLEVNEAKIRACEDTPFLKAPLLHDFGYDANTPQADQVLQGTYTPPHSLTNMLVNFYVLSNNQRQSAHSQPLTNHKMRYR